MTAITVHVTEIHMQRTAKTQIARRPIMGIHVEALLAAHRPEVQHEQNNHDDIICHEAAAEQAADDVYNNSRDLSISQGMF